MRERTIRLRRARCLLMYWRDGRMFLHNFARRLTVTGRPVTSEVLDFFSEWRTFKEAIAHFADYAPRSVRSAISQIADYGMLVPKRSAEITKDSRIEKEGSFWKPEGSFH